MHYLLKKHSVLGKLFYSSYICPVGSQQSGPKHYMKRKCSPYMISSEGLSLLITMLYLWKAA